MTGMRQFVCDIGIDGSIAVLVAETDHQVREEESDQRCEFTQNLIYQFEIHYSALLHHQGCRAFEKSELPYSEICRRGCQGGTGLPAHLEIVVGGIVDYRPAEKIGVRFRADGNAVPLGTMLSEGGNRGFYNNGIETYAEALPVGKLNAVTGVGSEALAHLVIPLLIGIGLCNPDKHIAADHHPGNSHRFFVIVFVIDRNPALGVLRSIRLTLGHIRQHIGIARKTERLPFHFRPVYAFRLGVQVFLHQVAFVQQFAAYAFRSLEIHRDYGILPGNRALRDFRIVIPVTLLHNSVVQGMIQHSNAHFLQQGQVIVIAWKQAHIVICRMQLNHISFGGIEGTNSLGHILYRIRILQLFAEFDHAVPNAGTIVIVVFQVGS